MHLDYNTNTNTTWTRDESIALWNLAQARPAITAGTSRLAQFNRNVNDAADALGLYNDPDKLYAFRSAAWYGEVVR